MPSPYLLSGRDGSEGPWRQAERLRLAPPPAVRSGVRLALVTDTVLDINGVARFVSTLARRAQEREIPLAVFAPAMGGNFPAGVTACRCVASIRVPKYPQLRLGLPRPRALALALSRFDPQCVHVSTPGPAGLLARRWALSRGVPLAATYHTDFPAYTEHLFGHESLTAAAACYMTWFYRPVARVFLRSTQYAASVRRLGVAADRTFLLKPGIELSQFHANGRVPAKTSHVRCLYVGRLSVEKNLPMLVELWPRLRATASSRGVSLTLDVAGEGPYEPAMRSALKQQGAAFHGVLRGRELADLYRRSDLFLFPSTTDTLGQVVMEAQACGVPVLVSEQGGPKEVTCNGVTGIVLPDVAERWIEETLRLACDPTRRALMSDAAANYMLSHGFDQSLDAFVTLHEELIGRPASRS